MKLVSRSALFWFIDLRLFFFGRIPQPFAPDSPAADFFLGFTIFFPIAINLTFSNCATLAYSIQQGVLFLFWRVFCRVAGSARYHAFELSTLLFGGW
jgi:hypothetical protein